MDTVKERKKRNLFVAWDNCILQGVDVDTNVKK